MTITTVTEELCTTAVVTAPQPHARGRLSRTAVEQRFQAVARNPLQIVAEQLETEQKGTEARQNPDRRIDNVRHSSLPCRRQTIMESFPPPIII